MKQVNDHQSYSLTLIFLLSICLLNFTPLQGADEPLHLYIKTSEGGHITQSRVDKFKTYLQQHKCDIQQVSYGNNPEFTADILFLPIEQPLPRIYGPIAKIKVINNDDLSGSILVRGATGINSVTSLSDTRIAYLSPHSMTGYQLQDVLFKASGVKHNKNKITYTHTNIAAFILLLHKDVFTAAVATPLANKWAKANDLTIVATSKPVKPGGLWGNLKVPVDVASNCATAFQQITSTERKNKKLMKLFPAWIDSFTL